MKPHLRKAMKELLEAMSPDIVEAKSRSACAALIEAEEFASAESVMIYLPMPAEVNTTHLALAAWQAGKAVLAPRVSWEQRHMIAIEIESLDSGLEDDRHGLVRPAEGSPYPSEAIDLIIVPALAYDRVGNRLGRGGGFYDRFLAHPEVHAVTCGLAFAEQIVESLPIHPNDQPVDMIVTDKEILRVKSPD